MNEQLIDVLSDIPYQDIYKTTKKWLSKNKIICAQDFRRVWSDVVTASYNDEEFTPTNLELAIEAMNKILDAKEVHKIIFSSWTIDILLHEQFNQFLKTYHDKILKPNLTPIDYLQDIEKETLLLNVALDIGVGFSNELLQNTSSKAKEDVLMNLMPLLQAINKGSNQEKLKVFENIDTVFEYTPMFKEKIFQFLGLTENSSFIQVVGAVNNSIKKGEIITNFDLKEILKLAQSYELNNTLQESLQTKEILTKKPKI